jgi:hypothetical protein
MRRRHGRMSFQVVRCKGWAWRGFSITDLHLLSWMSGQSASQPASQPASHLSVSLCTVPGRRVVDAKLDAKCAAASSSSVFTVLCSPSLCLVAARTR